MRARGYVLADDERLARVVVAAVVRGKNMIAMSHDPPAGASLVGAGGVEPTDHSIKSRGLYR